MSSTHTKKNKVDKEREFTAEISAVQRSVKNCLDKLKIKANIESGTTTNLYVLIDVLFINSYQYKKFQNNLTAFLDLLHLGQVSIANYSSNNKVRLEIPKKDFSYSHLSEFNDLIDQKVFNEYDLPIVLGINEENEPVIHDLANDHLNIIANDDSEASKILDCLSAQLMAGKSNKNFKFVFLGSDGKNMIRFNHLIDDYVFLPLYNIMIGEGMNKTELFLDLLFDELDTRNDLLIKSHSRNFKVYNAKSVIKVPHIVIFINDYQELLYEKSVTLSKKLAELASFGSTVNFHIVLLTSYKMTFNMSLMIRRYFTSKIVFNRKFINSDDFNDIKNKRPVVDFCGYGDGLFIKEKGKEGYWQTERIQFPMLNS